MGNINMNEVLGSPCTDCESTTYTAFTDQTRNGDDAKAYCESLGTTLATVITQEDRANLTASVKAAGIAGSVLIGLRDDDSEGNFKWVDGTACPTAQAGCMGSSYWNPGEPNNFGSGEDCVEYELRGGLVLGLNDLPCTGSSHNRYTVCNAVDGPYASQTFSNDMFRIQISETTAILSAAVMILFMISYIVMWWLHCGVCRRRKPKYVAVGMLDSEEEMEKQELNAEKV